MNAKHIIASLVTAVAAFFGGWLLFGVLYTDFYGLATIEVAKPILKQEPEIWAIGLANLAWSVLLVWFLQKSGETTFITGFVTSLRVSFLIMLVFDLSMYAFWNIYTLTFIITDIAVSTLFWGVMGGIAGAILGRGTNLKSAPERL